jgi:two-component system cell cycle sensor histidine kinase/response regulator CckA
MTHAESVAAEAAKMGTDTPLFCALVENVNECACLLDPQGRHVDVNRRYCEWLGRPAGELVGRTVCDIWPRALAERILADHQRVLRGEHLERCDQWSRDGGLVAVRVVGIPVRDGQGRVWGQLRLFGEMHPAPATDQQRQASRLETLGRLAAGAAHDFNNLLTLVRGHLALLEQKDEPAGRRSTAALDRVLQQGTDLSRQMLALARKESPEPRLVNLNSVVADLSALLQTAANSRLLLETRLRPDLAAVLAVPGQMVQVLLNLCLNARDAMPRGGRLLIETEERNCPCRDRGGREYGPVLPFVCLRVSDTGEGMGPEVQAHLFEPFFTTKQAGQGNGLGLNAVDEIVRRYGGWIECASSRGDGTRFEVCLPAAPSADACLSPPAPEPAAALGTVLLVDNDLDVLQIARMVLERRGYRVLVAHDGREALEVFTRQREQIAVVLLDRNMPELSGEEVLVEMRRLDPGVRVVLASGYTVADLDPQTQAQLCGFLAKPYRPAELLEAIGRALGETDAA